MTNNDILRRIRYIFNLSDSNMISTFALGELTVNRETVSDWLKKEDDPAYIKIKDQQLAHFLNGFIADRRGKKEGVTPIAEKILDNNIILRKLRIALDLQSDDIIHLLNTTSSNISKHELSAFFRKKTHKHYRQCQDQVFRNFLNALQNKYNE